MTPDSSDKTRQEKEIESLLSRFKPQPTRRLQEKMRSAPWKIHDYAQSQKLRRNKRPIPRLAWGGVLALVILLAACVTLIPPVRAIARQIIFSFIPSPSNQIVVQVTPASPGDEFNFTDSANFQLSVDQAQKLAGFIVKQFIPIPGKMVLVGARYEASYHAVILFYQGEQFSLFLTQRLLNHGQDVFSIGPDAHVQLVMVADVQGEYVLGGWKAISTQPATSTQTPRSQVNITATWDDTLPQSTLRWQKNGMAYELRLLGQGAPSQSDVSLWANELK